MKLKNFENFLSKTENFENFYQKYKKNRIFSIKNIKFWIFFIRNIKCFKENFGKFSLKHIFFLKKKKFNFFKNFLKNLEISKNFLRQNIFKKKKKN